MSSHDDLEQQAADTVASGDAPVVKRESARRTRRSFLVGGVTAAAAYGAFEWIDRARPIDRIQAPLRHTLRFNADVNRAVWAERGLAPEYPVSMAVPLRLNGNIGMAETLELDSWRLQLAGSRNAKASPHYVKDVTAWEYGYAGDAPATPAVDDVKSAPGNGGDTKTGHKARAPLAPAAAPLHNPVSALNPTGAVDSAAGAAVAAKFAAMAAAGQPKPVKRNIGDDEAGPSFSSLDIGTPGLLLAMADLQAKLPRVEFCTQFKCIEGWSNITQWAGFRLRDLLELYPPALDKDGRAPRYVYMETPDGNYYGGYNMSAAMHPQSLLVTEMDGKPLTQEHGAPLRLHMPIKYGYKQLKRIGLIAYSFQKPDDYWTHLGYDWFAGL